jgi:hypothetical protein
VCAIHQPNLFPRLSTLAKLYTADRWIALDDVQFARREYQHRARLADRDEPARQQWLTLPTHLPQGRSTSISQARLVDPRRSRRTVQSLVRQYYGRSPHWQAVSDVLAQVLDTLDTSHRVADIARTSTTALLRVLGWPGKALASSEIPTRQAAPSAWRISRKPPAAPTRLHELAHEIQRVAGEAIWAAHLSAAKQHSRRLEPLHVQFNDTASRIFASLF